MPEHETIVALATPGAESALALIRISGSAVSSLINSVFPKKSPPPPRRAIYGDYKALDGSLLDQLVYVYYQGPASFTGEDMLEMSPHGNPYIVQRIMEDLCARGCRIAEPGEFTRTAFLNGKLDLTQAEAIVDVIRARSEKALTVAQKQLSGSLGTAVEPFINTLLQVTAHLEAYIDFPEEDLPPEDVEGPLSGLNKLINAIDELLATVPFRRRLHDGVRVVLLGEPNVGKSSLMNTLLGEDRAIVSAEAGTTRDYLEDKLLIGSHLVRLTDTAGLREGGSAIEQDGIRKSLRLASDADLMVIVVDGSAPPPPFATEWATLFETIPVLVLENKIDLGEDPAVPAFLPQYTHAKVSALTGQGVGSLRGILKEQMDKHYGGVDSSEIALSSRHADALREAREHIVVGLAQLKENLLPELAAVELHLAIEAVGRITGKIDNERMLDELFSTFCIGK